MAVLPVKSPPSSARRQTRRRDDNRGALLALTCLVFFFGAWQHYLTAQLLRQQEFDLPKEFAYVTRGGQYDVEMFRPADGVSVARPWTIDISAKKPIAITGAPFTCFTMDTTDDRSFFDLDFREPKLRFLAKQLATSSNPPSYIRVGGTGSDFLTYLTNNSAGCVNSGPYANPGPPRSNPKGQVKKYYQGGEMCLTAERLDALIGLWIESGAPVVFGLNVEHRVVPGGEYDPRNAVELVRYCARRGFFFAGFQLGNEVNLELSPEQHAKDFLNLASAIDPVYDANGKKRPFYVGPDTHSLHQGGESSKYEARILSYLAAFQRNVLLMTQNLPQSTKIDFRGIGHHEYTQVRVPGAVFPVPAKEIKMIGGSWRPWKDPLVTSEEAFSRIERTSRDVVATLRPSGTSWRAPGGGPLELWASEIGPHNAGHPPCVEGGRWANFGEGFWWLYTLAAKAREGYDTVCRQDLIGADYALLDCKTHDPLPDYYLTILWNRLMGRRVLEVSVVPPLGSKEVEHVSVGRRRLQSKLDEVRFREFVASAINARHQQNHGKDTSSIEASATAAQPSKGSDARSTKASKHPHGNDPQDLAKDDSDSSGTIAEKRVPFTARSDEAPDNRTTKATRQTHEVSQSFTAAPAETLDIRSTETDKKASEADRQDLAQQTGYGTSVESAKGVDPLPPKQSDETLKRLRDKASYEAIIKGELGPGVADENSSTGEGSPKGPSESEGKDPAPSADGNPRFFAHCSSVQGRGVVLGVLNPTRKYLPINLSRVLDSPGKDIGGLGPIYDEYILTSEHLGSAKVKLNGDPIEMGLVPGTSTDLALPRLPGRRRRVSLQSIPVDRLQEEVADRVEAHIVMPPQSYGFLHFPAANVEACEK